MQSINLLHASQIVLSYFAVLYRSRINKRIYFFFFTSNIRPVKEPIFSLLPTHRCLLIFHVRSTRAASICFFILWLFQSLSHIFISYSMVLTSSYSFEIHYLLRLYSTFFIFSCCSSFIPMGERWYGDCLVKFNFGIFFVLFFSEFI